MPAAAAPRAEGWQEDMDLERELEAEREVAAEAGRRPASEQDGPQLGPEDLAEQEPGYTTRSWRRR